MYFTFIFTSLVMCDVFLTGHTADYASETGAGKAIFGINTFDIPLPTWQELYKEQLQAPMFVFQVGTRCSCFFLFFFINIGGELTRGR